MSKAKLVDEIERLAAVQPKNRPIDPDVNDLQDIVLSREQGFSAVFENMPAVAFVRDLNRRFVQINQAYELTYDVSRNDVLGQRLSEVFPDFRGEEFAEQDQDVTRTGRTVRYEETIKISDRERYFDCVRFPVMDSRGVIAAIGGIEIDITERRQAMDAQKSSETLLHTIFDSINYGVLLLDVDLKIRMANRAYREILNIQTEFYDSHPSFRDEMAFLRQRNFYNLENEDWDAYVDSRIQNLRSKETVNQVIELTDGRTLHFECIALSDGRRILNYFDITARIKGEREREEQAKQLAMTLQNMDQGIMLIGPNDYIVQSNPRTAELLKVPEELLTKRPHMGEVVRYQVEHTALEDTAFTGSRSEGDYRGFSYAPAEWRELLRGGMRYYRRGHPDGTMLDVRTLVMENDWVVRTFTDVTNDQKSERELAEKEQQLRMVLDHVPGGIRYFDENLRYVFYNKQYFDLWGFPEDLIKVGDSAITTLEFLADRGDFGEGDRQELMSARLAELKSQLPYYESTTASGRELACHARPDGRGGFVSIYSDITERKRAETLLKAAKREAELNAEILHTTFESIDQGIAVVDSDNQIINCNSRWAELLDLPAAFVTTPPNLREIFQFQLERGEHDDLPGDDDQRLAALLSVPERTHTLDIQERRSFSGRVLEMRSSSAPSGGRVRTFTDITERKNAERRLEIAKNEAETASDLITSIFRTISQGICVLDEDGQILACNARWAELTDLPEALISPPPHLRDIIKFQMEFGSHPHLTGSLDQRIETRVSQILSLDDGQIHQYETTTGRYLEIQSSRISQGRRVDTFTDITEHRLQEALLADAKHLAEEANRAKSAFLASMSHEIRTPLSGITGFLELLQYSDLTADQRSMVRSVNLSAKHLIDLIGDVLDFSKIEAGHLDLSMGEVSPRSLLDEVISVVSPLAQEKLVDLHDQLSPRTPETLQADPVRLRQILVNLVGNAVKFSESGAVHIDVLPRRSGETGEWSVWFEVTDTGIGFDPISTPDLFGEFRQADDSTTRRFGGTGLGLAISKRLVEMMGGEIGYDAEPERGAWFWFTIPLNHAPPQPASPKRSSELSVLLLGENTEIKSHAIDLTTRAGFSVELDLLAVPEEKMFDAAVVVDRLPDAAGREFRSYSKTRILISADAGFEAKNNALHAGFTQILSREAWISSLVHHVGESGRHTNSPLAEEFNNDISDNFSQLLRPSVANLPILVIDDIEMNRQIAGRQLDMLNLPHEFANDGEQGLAKVRENRYAAVIVDVSMPIMDGYEFTKHFRLLEQNTGNVEDRRTTVVALTANVTADDAEKCISAGMDDYMSKPLTMGRLSQMLIKWLGVENIDLTPQKIDDKASKSGVSPSRLEESDIDFVELNDILGTDDPEELHEYLQEFVTHVSGYLNELDDALEARNEDLTRETAHTMSGSAKYAGAKSLAKTCFSIERAVGSASWEELSFMADAARSQLSRIEDIAHRLETDG